ncbi:universal stress protein [Natrialbaceae archaeon GCM10025810]|uniref:universal stress protein n=1 Tax=Halovalidus salilacus TaxID=3075124 RepID=UPI0036110794
MTTILLPVTDHGRWTRAVATVAATIEDDDTDAVVLYAFTDADVESTTDHLGIDDNPELDELAQRKSGVGQALSVLEDGGIDTEVYGLAVEDRTGEEILAVASDREVDRIYMYSRKRTPAGKAVFGSALQRVLFDSDVPVVVTPPNVA